jgi:hypothetical protein
MEGEERVGGEVERLDFRCAHEMSGDIIGRVWGIGCKWSSKRKAVSLPARHGGQAAGRLGPATPSGMEHTQMTGGVMWQCTENRGVRRTAFQSGFYLRYLIGRLEFNE